jgi:hypothetical protein
MRRTIPSSSELHDALLVDPEQYYHTLADSGGGVAQWGPNACAASATLLRVACT